MSSGPDTWFSRLLRRALPHGGVVAVMHEGYFDESYRFDHSPKTFCVAGYFLHDDAAREMEQEWSSAVERHDLPYFHMKDCAHGLEAFKDKTKEERVEIEKEFIALIKKHTLHGFAVAAREGDYRGFDEDTDIYGEFSEMAVTALAKFLEMGRIEGDIAYFFESGYVTETSASARIASQLQGSSDSVTFGGKEEYVLTQAADLLAWQCRKYVQDWESEEHGPRDDFKSLVEHPHTFFHVLTGGDRENSLGVEAWPLSRRAPFTEWLSFDHEGPMTIMREEGREVPIIPVKEPAGWKMGAGQMAFTLFEDADENQFALAFDEPRMQETIHFLLAAMDGIWGRAAVLPFDSIEVVDRTEQGVMLGLTDEQDGVRLAVLVPHEALQGLLGDDD